MDIAMDAVRQRSSCLNGKRTCDRFLRDVELAREVFASLEMSHGRCFTAEEVRALELQGNWATDWSLVRVRNGHIAIERIRGCLFHGPVQLGSLSGEVSLPGAEHCPHPCGVYNSTLAECVVGNGVLVKGCNSLSRCLIGHGAVVSNCGLVSCSKLRTPTSRGSRFANGTTVALGPRTGGREVVCYATMRLAEATAAATDRASTRAIAEHRAEVDAYADLASCEATVIGSEAVVMSCPRVVDVFLGPKAFLESCSVEEATILSSPKEPSRVINGSTVMSSLIQEGVSISRGSIVSDSLLMEHSHVKDNAKVILSIVGPDSGVGAGECRNSLMGPFVGFQHQSLLISTIWPCGRGNVAYGANIGSNHTSRQPDQELWPGEGMFFGLSVGIKFPANYSESPFGVIASGVVCLPQRVAFPFCLINSPEHSIPGLSPVLNHLRPGWVLAESLYMIIRNEDNYKSCAKARYNRVDWPIFRPSTMRLMVDARARLVAAGARKTKELSVGDSDATTGTGMKDIYIGDRDVAGLGKNYMTEASRVEGIAAYTLHLCRYALRGLLAQLEAGVDSSFLTSTIPETPSEVINGMPAPIENALETARLLTLECLSEMSPGGMCDVNEMEDWELQKSFLAEEYGGRDPKSLMEELIAIEAQVARAVEISKTKDDRRGSKIIPGYADAHTPAELEKPVKLAYSQQEDIETRARAVMSCL